MRHIRKLSGIAVLAGASAAAIAVSAFAAEYSMTVNRDRLINAQNEPQNWLMMNGDYGSMRYSKLTQFNRDNVKNLRMVWALALGGMQDVGQNGPENEVNPLAGARSTRSTPAIRTRASSCGSAIPAFATRAMSRARAASRYGTTS